MIYFREDQNNFLEMVHLIYRNCVYIKSTTDYEKILNYVDPQYIDEDLISQLVQHIGLQCQTLLIEYPYYENDYLSNYYIFYVKKLQKFPKECYRILFYKDRMARTLMGYITLRPTYKDRHLGKIYFDPQYLVSERASLILGNYKCHVGGSEAVINLFPHMKQEGDVAVCAHVATWSVIRSFSNRFHRYPELTIGQIVEMVSPESERMIPSHGLTAFQISQVFLDAGFSPVVLLNDERNPRLIKEALISYVSSGIPIVAVLTNRNHAISVIGVGDRMRLPDDIDFREFIETIQPFESYWENGNEVTTNVVLSSRFYNSISVNDDNRFPYTMVRMKNSTRAVDDKDSVPYTIPEVDRLIVPLYPRIQLTYEDVRTFFLRLAAANKDMWNGPIIGRIYLASANTYREYINESCEELDSEIKAILMSIEMPKFIWCIEVSTPENYQLEVPMIDALVIIDSTSATINPEPFLFVAFPNGTVRYREESDVIKEHKILNFKGLSIPHFTKNLREVN